MDTLEDLQDDNLIEWEHFHSSNNEQKDGHFSVRKNVILERTKFNQRQQEAGETADDFITALHCLSQHCGYGALLSEMIRDRLVAGLRDRRLSMQLQMDPEITLDKAVTVISQTELVEKQKNLLENTFNAASSATNVDSVLSYSKHQCPANVQYQSEKKNQYSETPQQPQTTHENGEEPIDTDDADDFIEDFSPGGEKPHYCSYCGSSFQKVRHLIRHQRSHTGEKPHHCPDCDRSFAQLVKLKSHQKIHVKNKCNFHFSDSVESFVLLEKLEKHQLENTFNAASSAANVDCVLIQQRTFRKVRESKRQKRKIRTRVPSHSKTMLEKEEEPLDTDDSDEWNEGFSPEGEKPHYCSDCSKSFRKLRDLIRHQRLHTGEKPHHCPDCDRSFARLDKLKLHKEIHMKEEDNVTRNHQTELNVDRVHTQQRTASRGRGRQKSNMRAGTPGKMGQSQTGKDLSCKSSVRKNQHSEKLQQPQTTQENEEDPENTSDAWTESFSTVEKPYICSDCSKSFKQENHLIRHQRTHTGEKPYDCPDCDKSFARLDNLKLHQKTHMEERNFHCSDCVKSFVRFKQLEKHQLTHKSLETHLSKRKRFLCTICGKECRNMKTHMRVHTGETPYHCSECGKSFPYTKSYQRHLLTHNTSGERATYPCLQCGKTFTRRDGMVRHVRRIHTGERNHQCRDCGKRFFRKETLKRHMLVHTGEKPYQCSVCGQRFSQDGDRKRHEKRHYAGLSDFLDL